MFRKWILSHIKRAPVAYIKCDLVCRPNHPYRPILLRQLERSLIMSGIEVAVGTHFLDTLANIVFEGLSKHRPKNQTKKGNDYLDGALVLTEEYRAILTNRDRIDIENEFQAAETLKAKLEIHDSWKSRLITSHKYKHQAKNAFALAKKLSTLRRMAQAFAMDVADAVVEIAEQEESSVLDDATKEELRLRVVTSIESSPEGRAYSHENTSAVEVATVAQKVWAMVKLENLIPFYFA
ncbi:hypothetical protein EVG20_g7535 [Dentipellis fragilis]|uniref:Uncharacterized protein n=1 Tax=Dentipellis fragilis TaxID=205917 RepID=A0A4Y9YE35_9AGAM|nr:hypothetical protein EVG20_g7535 [Dentipellis fragilis]